MSWPTTQIASVARIVSGATPSTAKAEYWNGGICWATPKDISDLNGSKFLYDTPRKITEVGLRSCSAEILPPNSVLFSSRAPIGLVAINQVPTATNQGFKSFVPEPTKLDAGYLYHWLRTNRSQLERMGVGATFAEVSKAIVSRIEIPLPPLDEQRRIAAILDRAEELRAKRRAAIALLDQLPQAIFLETFGDPAANPKGWPTVRLSELYEFKNGINFSADQKGKGTLTIDVLNMYSDSIFANLANLYRVDLELREDRMVRRGDLLFVRSSVKAEGVGWPALFPGYSEPVTYCGFIIRGQKLWTGPDVDASFVVHALRFPAIRSRVIAKAGKVALTNINQEQLGSIRLPLPYINLQHRFAARVEAIHRARAAQQSSLAEIDALFASLQAKVFAGDHG